MNLTVGSYENGVYAGGTPDRDIVTQRAYDALDRTLIVTDVLNFATRYGYNGLDQTTVITDSVGRVTRSGYDGTGTQRWNTTSDGRVTVQLVDGLGRVVTTIQNYQDGTTNTNELASDLITRVAYDAVGRRVRLTDAEGRITVLAYDNRDRLITVTENYLASGCTAAMTDCNIQTQYRYDRADNRTAVIDGRGLVTQRATYTAANEQRTLSDGMNRTTTFEYDAGGRQTKRIDPRGVTNDLTYTYDGLDRPTGMSATNLGSISMGYDGLGRRLSLVDGTGSTTFTYDALGRMRSATAPNTGQIGYSYTGRGERAQITYPSGPTLMYTYLPDGQLDTVVQGATTLADYGYDPIGRLSQVVRSNGATTTYGYDTTDRLYDVHTTVGGTTRSRFTYGLNRLGLRTNVTEQLPSFPAPSANTNVTTKGAERADGVEEPRAVLPQHAASAASTNRGPGLALIGPPAPPVRAPAPRRSVNHQGGCTYTTYTGDGTGSWGQYSAPTAYANGTTIRLNARSVAAANGLVINSAATSVVATLVNTTTLFTVSGAQTYRVGFGSTTAANISDNSVEIEVCPPGGSPTPTFTATNTPTNTPTATATATATPGGGSCTITRYRGDGSGSWGQYSAATAYASGTTIRLAARSVAAANGMVLNSAASSVVATLVNTTTLFTVSGAQTYRIGYTSSTAANISDNFVDIAVCPPGGNPTPTFTPTATATPVPGLTTRTLTYGYDRLQRLTSILYDSSPTFSYTYDKAGNRTDGGRTYNAANEVNGWSYDNAGNLLSDGTTTRTYDALSRVLTSGTATYAYNGDGTLISATTGGTTTRYTQDLAAPLSQVLQTIVGSTRTSYLYGHERLAMDGSPRTWFVHDALGSMRQTLNDSGVAANPTSYGPWGQPQQTLATPFGFAGELQQSGDVYLRARWYTPSSGQFVSKDPFAGMAEMPYSLNPYQYAYSNPVLLTDATGERPGVPINARDVTLWLYLEMRQNVDDARLQQIRNYNSEGNELTKRAIIHPFKKCLEAILASAYSSSIALQNIQNIEEETKLQLIAASTAYASGGLGFYGLVADQKPWDFKHSILRLLGSGVTLCGNQGCKNDVEYSVPGNIHFGFVAGEAGYSGGISLLGAGVAEASDPAHDPEKAAAKNVAYTGPYDPSGKFDVRINSDGFGIKFYNIGDDPKDAAAVRFGLDLHRKYGRSLTFATFSQELSSVLPSLASAAPFPQPVLSTITKDWPYNVGYFAP